ncbi:MAG: DegV family protein [Peptococcaceae bacterium]|nr:DegV family protein [Peptococcaceae bacterium]
MAIKIITDSTSDLPEYLLEELDISIVPLKVLFGEEVYRDRIDLSNPEFYAKMSGHKELPTTAQVNPGEFIEEFSKHIDGGNEIIGIFISSKLSGTFSSAVIAKETLAKGQIYLIDSKNASFGLGLMVIEAARMAKQGKTAQEIVVRLESLIDSVPFYGIIDNLENLKKGGRLSSTGAFAGNLLGIKPIISLKDGAVVMAGKARGLKKAYSWVLEDIKSKNYDLNGKSVAIAHAAAKDDLAEFKQLILKEYKPKEIIEFEIGAVIGTHTGGGCIGISCF